MSKTSVARVAMLLALVGLLVPGSLALAGSAKPQMAPPNPEFVAYVEALRAGRAPAQVLSDGRGLGYIPEPIDHTFYQAPSADQKVLPATYDLRTTSKLTAIRNQLNCGSCWAFAAYSSSESNLLTGETRDFSEQNLKNTHGFDYAHCSGGNATMSMAYMARWSGPVNESDDPYNYPVSTSPAGLPIQKHLHQTIVLPARASYTDNNAIKQAVMDFGAVQASYYHADPDTPYYSSTYKSYYYSVAGTTTNHAVAIVGWDDNFPAANFVSAPAGNGAFLMRNSWGTSWGDAGYFWISYYDTRFSRFYVFKGLQPTSSATQVYQYDPLGWVTSVGYGTDNLWYSNVYTASASEQLFAVGLYAPIPSAAYTVRIYTGVTADPTTGATLASETSGTLTYAGFNTINLATPVSIASGQKFSVVVHMTTTGYTYPVAFEYVYAGFSSGATSGAGQSYMGEDGAVWEDVTTWGSPWDTGNNCIKAYMRAATGDPGSDFNANGKADVFWRSQSTGENAVWLMNGGTIDGGAVLPTVPDPWYVEGYGDFNGDHKADILFQNYSTHELAIWYMDGTTVSGSAVLPNSPTAWHIDKNVGDFDGDGTEDLFFWKETDGSTAIWFITNGTVTSSAVLPAVGAQWELSWVGDFNGDGKADVFFRNTTTGENAIWLMNGGNIISGHLLTTVVTSWSPAGLGDFDGDGKADILWRSNSTGEGAIWFMNGGTIASGALIPTVASPWAPKAIGDFNGGGKADIWWRNSSTGENAVWFMNGSTIESSALPTTVAASWSIQAP